MARPLFVRTFARARAGVLYDPGDESPRRRQTARRLALEPLERRALLAASSPFDTASVFAAPLVADYVAAEHPVALTWNDQQAPVYAGEWVVKIDTGAAASMAAGLATAQQRLAPAINALESVEPLASANTFLIRTSTDYSLNGIQEALAQVPGFQYVEPNFVVWKNAVFPDDSSFDQQWALHNTGQSGGVVDADIDAPEAWDINTGSGAVVVGVVDSGVNYNHVDLDDNMWRNPGEIPGDGIDNDDNGFIDDVYGWDFFNGDSDPMDDDGHGTAVAGIIAAEGDNSTGVAGVNWDAQIMALKIFDPIGFAGTAQIAGAINYATMMKLEYGVNIIATNHSWGTVGYSSVLYDAIAAHGEADILLVASAGNEQHDNDVAPQYPASYDLDHIISVAATDRYDQLASFSSYGATTVDLGAPGVRTRTTHYLGGYTNFGGTSAASPYVAAVAALVYDTFPQATALEVKQAILDGTDTIAALTDITLTDGRLNAFGALKAMSLKVIGATPGDSEVLSAPPTEFTFELNFDVDAATVEPSDLTVNGLAANGVSVVGSTVTFTYNSSPVTSQGPQQMLIAAGAFLQADSTKSVQQFSATFYYDDPPLAVVGHAPNTSATLPFSEFTVDFNQPVDPASIQNADLIVSEGTVTDHTVLGDDTVVFRLAGVVSDRIWKFTLPAGAVRDLDGNPNAAYAGELALDIISTPAAPFERLQPLGSLISQSRNRGRITSALDADSFEFFAQAGETVAVRVTPNDVTAHVGVSVGGLVSPVQSPAPGQPVIVDATAIGSDGVVSVMVTADRATDYVVEIVRNAAIEKPAASPPQNIGNSALQLGSRRLAVVGTIAPSTVDEYVVELGTGRPADIVLRGQQGVSLAGATLELIAPGGAVTVANAYPQGAAGLNYDLAILGYVPSVPGEYHLRLTSPVAAQYAIVVTDQGLLFEREINDGPQGTARSLDAVRSAAGFISGNEHLGRFEFVVDAGQSQLDMSGGVGIPDILVFPLTPQAPGSLSSALSGVLHADVSANSISLLPSSSVSPMEKPGPFDPGNAPADFAASLDVTGVITGVRLALRDTVFGAAVDNLALDGAGNFDADALSFVIQSTMAVIIPGAFDENIELDATYIDNASAASGSLQLIGSEYVLTVPIHVRILIPVPDVPLAGILDIDGQIVARAPVAGPDDEYLVTLGAGQTITVATSTPFDNPAAVPNNTLDTAIQVLDADGVPLALDDNSAPDGRNAQLSFTAPAAGTYRIAVRHVGGVGEYVLHVDGHLGTEPELFEVTDVRPQDGALGNQPVSVFEIDVSGAIDEGTVQPDDLTVNGVPADQVEVVDFNTLRFTYNTPWTDGVHQVQVPAAALTSLSGKRLLPFDSEFTVDTAPPVVTEVLVAGSAWTPAFYDHLQTSGLGTGGYAIPTADGQQLAPLPWVNIDQVKIRFSEQVQLSQNALELRGIGESIYGLSGFSYDASTSTATWTLDASFLSAAGGLAIDRLLLELSDTVIDLAGNALDGEFANPSAGIEGDALPSGNGTIGGPFAFRFDVVPGDVNATGGVYGDDVLLVRNRQLSEAGQANYDASLDIDGSGAIDGDDLLLVRNLQFSQLPQPEDEEPLAQSQLSIGPDDDASASQAIASSLAIAATADDESAEPPVAAASLAAAADEALAQWATDEPAIRLTDDTTDTRPQDPAESEIDAAFTRVLARAQRTLERLRGTILPRP